MGEFSHAPADISHADDPERQTLEFPDPPGGRPAPLPLARHPVNRHQLLDNAEHQHDRVLGDRIRIHTGRVNDCDAQAGCGRKIDGIESHTVAAHHLQFGTGRQQAFRTGRVDPEENRFGLRCRSNHTFHRYFFGYYDPALTLEKIDGIGMDGSAENYERFGIRYHGSSTPLLFTAGMRGVTTDI
jgi:hypothetical protein